MLKLLDSSLKNFQNYLNKWQPKIIGQNIQSILFESNIHCFKNDAILFILSIRTPSTVKEVD